MGFLDSLTDTLLNGNANDAVSKIKNLGGGMLGELNETNQMAEELASRQRPGTLCFQSCPVDDERCEGCLAKQQEILV